MLLKSDYRRKHSMSTSLVQLKSLLNNSYLVVCFGMVSFRDQKNPEPCPDWSPLGDNSNFLTNIPVPFMWESPHQGELAPASLRRQPPQWKIVNYNNFQMLFLDFVFDLLIDRLLLVSVNNYIVQSLNM